MFLTLQSCLLEVTKADGGNGYKIPHMGKERLERLDILPNTLSCGFELYDKIPAVPTLQFILKWSPRSRQLKSKAIHTYIIDYIEPICKNPCFSLKIALLL